jgi:hypothetical protein
LFLFVPGNDDEVVICQQCPKTVEDWFENASLFTLLADLMKQWLNIML